MEIGKLNTHLLFTFQYIIILVKLLRKIIISLPSFLLFTVYYLDEQTNCA